MNKSVLWGVLPALGSIFLFLMVGNAYAQENPPPSTGKTEIIGISPDSLGSPVPPEDDSEGMARPFKKFAENLESLEKAEQNTISLNGNGVPFFADVELPSLDELKVFENKMQTKLHELLQEMLEDRFISVSVATRSLLNTFPITEGTTQISKVKLPGFPNHVWMPVDKRMVIGLVNQVQRYSTVFIIINRPITNFDIESLRQKIDEPIKELDLKTHDDLRVIYVPLAIPDMVDTEKLLEEPPPAKSPMEELLPGISAIGPIMEEELIEKAPDEEATAKSLAVAKEIKDDIAEPVITQEIEIKAAKHLLEARESYFADNLDKALDSIQKALTLNPRSAQGYAMLGSIYYRLRWNTLAAKQWKRSLELDPNNQEVSQYLERLE